MYENSIAEVRKSRMISHDLTYVQCQRNDLLMKASGTSALAAISRSLMCVCVYSISMSNCILCYNRLSKSAEAKNMSSIHINDMDDDSAKSIANNHMLIR